MDKNKTDEINILLPHREVVIASEVLTVREYSLNDTMQHYDEIDAFVVPLSKLLSKSESLNYSEVESLIAQRYESVLKLISLAINKPFDYVVKLGGKDGFTLIDAWWTVNSDFFINAAVRKLVQKAVQEQSSKPQIGGGSSQR